MDVFLIKDGKVENCICADSVERAAQFFPEHDCVERTEELRGFGPGDLAVPHEEEYTHVRHILVRAAPDRTDAEAEAILDGAQQRLVAGEDFFSVATEISEDTSIDLGWTNGAGLSSEFVAVMQATADGALSNPFPASDGWHILQVIERAPRNVYDVTSFSKAPYVHVIVPVSRLDFLRRFTAEQRIAIRASTDPMIIDGRELLDMAQEVAADDPDTVLYVRYLEQQGFISADDANRILEVQ